MKSREQQREARTLRREREQLKIAREIVGGKRDDMGRKIAPKAEALDVPADFTGRLMSNYISRYFIAGREVTAAEYRAHLDAE